ncbi:YbhB/YbcL family Raf kinase inhibitor-like protein [Actinomadura sp. BRA 177]|uniref:YbhB/YbcL family Raf kinase inhibitor-like protein n=1 Tax=Actinomadura sp. BRA 177 TaxID=2745202 RepID=UPI0015954086|nr:YbhB/YbcL family Raf kinase inhibitor-like protein [Actinomadura sp. BRA 177]NVI90678.1 YbhB/YbcL family Raf kinase inhibitor-like protein [Actinomadura sp. BRA 177]
MDEITLSSPEFADGGPIPAAHSHEAGDLSPALRWSGVPPETVELMLTCEDPDAPGGTFVHWMLAGIPRDRDGLAEGEAGERPRIARGRNGFGDLGYGGPQPPAGDDPHRYVFTLYALRPQSGLTSGFSPEDMRAAVRGKVITSGSLTGTYAR